MPDERDFSESALSDYEHGERVGYLQAVHDMHIAIEAEATRVYGHNSDRPERADGKPSKQLKFLWRMHDLLSELEAER